MSASPAKSGVVLRRMMTRNQNPRIHELCPTIKCAEYGQTEFPFAKHFFAGATGITAHPARGLMSNSRAACIHPWSFGGPYLCRQLGGKAESESGERKAHGVSRHLV